MVAFYCRWAYSQNTYVYIYIYICIHAFLYICVYWNCIFIYIYMMQYFMVPPSHGMCTPCPPLSVWSTHGLPSYGHSRLTPYHDHFVTMLYISRVVKYGFITYWRVHVLGEGTQETQSRSMPPGGNASGPHLQLCARHQPRAQLECGGQWRKLHRAVWPGGGSHAPMAT